MDLLRRAEAGFIVASSLDIFAIHGVINENQEISRVNISCEDSDAVSIAPFSVLALYIRCQVCVGMFHPVGAHPEVVYNSVMTAFGGDWQKATTCWSYADAHPFRNSINAKTQ